ncbi:hypothetical protein F5887DRAFT_851000, partial [Amanita rubescens]
GSVIVSGDDLTVYCWILNTDDPFPIDIGRSKTVGHLKKMIKKENEHEFAAIDAKCLVIWKLSSPILPEEINTKIRHVQSLEEIPCVKLSPLDKLSEHFSSAPRDGVHIIVEVP